MVQSGERNFQTFRWSLCQLSNIEEKSPPARRSCGLEQKKPPGMQEVLQLDANVQEAEKELEEVTVLLRQSLANTSQDKPRKTVPIKERIHLVPQVDGDEDMTDVPASESSCTRDNINLKPSSAYEFGQSLKAACCCGDTAAGAELLASTEPQLLPQYLSNQLDGHTISFIMKALDLHLLGKNPNLVYRHLHHLHTADRFSVVLMLLEKGERRYMTQLFEHLSAVESTEFTKGDVQNLANKYI
ncbi:hypothetical protein GOODEAATRI_012876 [Goodea atripinnis]|uniref:RNA-polymerase II-associated protein 3-like C-terminal domain-containing protein n=1 Tax=Goodea atripinnis TaxID=208336 RepID=A0ABV0N0X3_9TELE